MGAAQSIMPCCACSRDNFKNREADLLPPELEGNENEFQKFELSFPFSRTYPDIFAKWVR